jgi:hypothetical protein
MHHRPDSQALVEPKPKELMIVLDSVLLWVWQVLVPNGKPTEMSVAMVSVFLAWIIKTMLKVTFSG